MRSPASYVVLAMHVLSFAVPMAAQGDSRPRMPESRAAEPKQTANALAWVDLLHEKPDPRVIRDAGHRSAMEKAGLPWHVRDKGSGIEMLLIPPGAYMRGAIPGDSDAEADEKPTHQVTITKAF